MVNTQIFSDMGPEDSIRLESSLNQLFNNIDTIGGRKSILRNGGVDDYE